MSGFPQPSAPALARYNSKRCCRLNQRLAVAQRQVLDFLVSPVPRSTDYCVAPADLARCLPTQANMLRQLSTLFTKPGTSVSLAKHSLAFSTGYRQAALALLLPDSQLHFVCFPLFAAGRACSLLLGLLLGPGAYELPSTLACDTVAIHAQLQTTDLEHWHVVQR